MIATKNGTVKNLASNQGKVTCVATRGVDKVDVIYQLAYGIEINTQDPNPIRPRVGYMDFHKVENLPIQSNMRSCLLRDDGTVNYYLHPDNKNLKADGTPSVLDGTDGMVMVKIPAHYRRFQYKSSTVYQALISEYPLPGFHYVPKAYISAYEATVDRTVSATPKLASVVNLTAEFRGGANSAAEIAHDADGGSSLGKPATNISLVNFRMYARRRGTSGLNISGWNCNVYDIQKTCYWLYAIEYANFNCQANFNGALTTDGYHQGGLGAGVTDLTVGNITAMTGGTYSCIPCGITNSLGNKTGIVTYTMPSEYGSVKTTNVPSYRGIENPFGHLWKWTDGCKCLIQADADGGLSEFYMCDNPANFTSSGIANYELRGNLPRANGYVKEMILGEYGEIMPLAIGAGSTTYFCDYFYTTNPPGGVSERGVSFGGSADSGAGAGFGYASSYHAPSSSDTNVGSRLCFIPE